MEKLLCGLVKLYSKDVIHNLIWKTCDNFCLRQTQGFKQRIEKYK